MPLWLVGGLPHNMSAGDLQLTFQSYGPIIDTAIHVDQETGERAGVCQACALNAGGALPPSLPPSNSNCQLRSNRILPTPTAAATIWVWPEGRRCTGS